MNFVQHTFFLNQNNFEKWYKQNKYGGTGYGAKSQLVIGTSRTVGSAKKFVRITCGFGQEDASQGMYMSKIEIFFFTAQILQNQRMLCCGKCFHD